MDKYPQATFTYDPYKLADYLLDNPDDPEVLASIRWLVRNGDRAGARSYPFVLKVTLGKASRRDY